MSNYDDFITDENGEIDKDQAVAEVWKAAELAAKVAAEHASKYTYYKVIQQNYGYGWGDVAEMECSSTGNFIEYKERRIFLNLVKDYKLLGYPTRVVYRRVLN